MNKHLQQTAILLFLSFATATGFAQTPAWTVSGSNLYLNPTTANLWLGLSSVSTSSKLRIDNTLATSSAIHGLYTTTNNTYSGAGNAYGIYSTSSLGVNNTGTCFGIQSIATNNNTSSTSATYGLRSTTKSYNAGTTYGCYTDATNNNSSSTSATYGIRSITTSDNAGATYGCYADATNNNSSSTSSTFGMRSTATSYNVGATYGYYTDVTNNNTSSTASVCGVRTSVTSVSSTSTVYGVYSVVSGGSKRWAGYFTGGDVYVSGNVGVGTTAPGQKLHVVGNSYFTGNVGVGVATPTAKLDVAGLVRAHDVKVCLNQGCDYVFEPDYKLMPLSELSTFVKTKKHLPEVAPAAVMESEGINVSEMSALLLKKVEELTLYILEQQKAIENLQRLINNN